MNRVKSACVATNSSKTCFVSLSAELAEVVGLRIQGQPFAIQLQWAEGKAFTSWSGDVVHRRKDEYQSGTQSVVQLGNKFADSLGLKDGDQVIVEPVTSIPSCNRICVDPVSANDWEILELHAGYIENQLLNQVRVVFCGQLLPIWIEKQTCVVVKIVAIEPEAFCLRLDEFTEVVVSPKTRNFATSNKDQQSSILETHIRNNASNLSSQGLQKTQGNKSRIVRSSLNGVRGNNSSGGSVLSYDVTVAEKDGANKIVEKSFISKVTGYVKSLFVSAVDQDHATDSGNNFNVTTSRTAQSEHIGMLDHVAKTTASTICTERLKKTVIDLYLRVQPEMEVDVFKDCSSCETEVSEHSNMTYYSQQPSTVFVNFSSLPRSILQEFSHHFSIFPPPNGTVVKNVQIKKISCPKERAAALRINDTGNRKDTTDISQKKESQETESVESDRVNPSNSSWIVRMVVMSGKTSHSVDHCTSEVKGNKDVLPKHVALSRELRLVLGANDLSLVKLESISHGPSNVQGIILHPFGNTVQKITDVVSPDSAIEAFQEWLYSVCSCEVPLIICSGMLVSFHTSEGEHIQFIVSVLSHQPSPDASDSLPYYHLTPDTVQQVTTVLGTHVEALQQLDQAVSSQEIHASRLKCAMKDLGGVTDNFEKCVHHALSSLGQRKLIAQLGGSITTGLSSGALLICGSGSGAGIGCGKTSLAHAVCHKLIEWPVCAHVTVVDCVPLRGKRVDVIQKNWQHVFAEAAWHQPSVVLFDDLDQVVSAPSALQELGGEALYKRRLAKVFKELINTEIINNNKVVVIATARSRDSLHPSLLTSRGCHIFQCCAELHPPDASQREEILLAIINKKMPRRTQEGLDLGSSSLMKKTEGFAPKDLCSLVDRALHMAASRKMQFLEENSISPVLTAEDFKIALEGFTPAALRGVSLHTAGELGWSDVGGLLKVKDALVEMLLWPTKYSWLFNKCPLRIRSGLLLYGPPGTGKTLLAGVVAKECGLNFISIKGPELLSKYIGASEQAVRDVFTRAQSAKPCILFFDEFDSLAPRRGHDSTGVTDRVVNQLLTQLDGVEGLDGVYVLAATSRPDLIDPALLRPGRLDKCLYCGIPDKSERLEILQALSRSLLLAEDTDLRVISDTCENFTGADFKALLYNAQLVAIHRCTSKHQLYKGIFENDEKSSNKNKDTPLQKRNLVYISSLEEGSKEMSDDEFTRLHSEVAVFTENLNRNVSSQKLSRSDSSGSQVTSGVKISQSDLLQAASSMGPSVSDSERLRYQTIYDTFINSRGGEFKHDSPGQGRATLA